MYFSLLKILFFLPSSSFLLSLSTEIYTAFDGNLRRRLYLKPLLFRSMRFQDHVSPDFEMFHECGNSCAFAVLNPHDETRFSPHVAPFERHVSLGSTVDGLPSSFLCNRSLIPQIRSPISINSATQLMDFTYL